MKLDRNITQPSGARRGKYALIKLREANYSMDGKTLTVNQSAVDFGRTPETDFFVIRLKDKYAGPALDAYAKAALEDDPEYAAEILHLASLANTHQNKRKPD